MSSVRARAGAAVGRRSGGGAAGAGARGRGGGAARRRDPRAQGARRVPASGRRDQRGRGGAAARAETARREAVRVAGRHDRGGAPALRAVSGEEEALLASPAAPIVLLDRRPGAADRDCRGRRAGSRSPRCHAAEHAAASICWPAPPGARWSAPAETSRRNRSASTRPRRWRGWRNRRSLARRTIAPSFARSTTRSRRSARAGRSCCAARAAMCRTRSRRRVVRGPGARLRRTPEEHGGAARGRPADRRRARRRSRIAGGGGAPGTERGGPVRAGGRVARGRRLRRASRLRVEPARAALGRGARRPLDRGPAPSRPRRRVPGWSMGSRSRCWRSSGTARASATTGRSGAARRWSSTGIGFGATPTCERFPLPGGTRAMRDPVLPLVGLAAEAFGAQADAWLADDRPRGAGGVAGARSRAPPGPRPPHEQHGAAVRRRRRPARHPRAARATRRPRPCCWKRAPRRRAPTSSSRIRSRCRRADPGAPAVLDFAPLLQAIAADRAAGASVAGCAARFHETLAVAAVAQAAGAGRDRVVLSGGCFQNRRLARRVRARLEAAGFSVHAPRLLPANDGGLSSGQAAVAAWRLERGEQS